MVKLVLFDIDGTLIRTGGAGVKAFERTFAEEFGLPEATRNVEFAGRTDTSLVRQCLRAHGLEADERQMQRFFGVYPRLLEELLRKLPGEVLPGIHAFIDELFALNSRPIVGLLTGNIRRGAELKLRHFGLWEKFETGAFADDNEDRNCIAATAKERGEALAGKPLSGEEVLVIGDTPHDVTCAKSIGAKCLAVATGVHSRDVLEQAEPAWAVHRIDELPVARVLGRT